MKKKNVIVLDVGDDSPDYSGWGFLIIHTDTPGYVFADDLNHLYNLDFGRAADLVSDDTAYPLFCHRDHAKRLDYYLLEQPATHPESLWQKGEKLLIVSGETAQETVERIDADFASPLPEADPSDLVATARYERLAVYQAALTLTTVFEPGRIGQYSPKALACLIPEVDNILDSIDLLVMS